MSFPNIPNITPIISVTREESIVMLLSSIALEEIALSHIMNAEGEKMQYVLGTLSNHQEHAFSVDDLLKVSQSTLRVMKEVVLKEILLQLKLSNVKELMENYVERTDSA